MWAVHGGHYFMRPVSASETGQASSIKYQKANHIVLQRKTVNILPGKRLLVPSRRLLVPGKRLSVNQVTVNQARRMGMKNPGSVPGSWGCFLLLKGYIYRAGATDSGGL